ncbi:hypothetical protein M409DRAFT_25544 [Zasmidium cellare ATCC 36951]|uniref:NAD-dependent epimerase/dehydratase domain-containing protein n=1 Tax=Zasmidium cellare ATCC 36951 TaxID=1080233 RepID=A0A6A6CAZ0_ZASCE|nr:uncharacterized protein M409DRAFT_25544 [Zasmidium cellare ATCC 36951]KAF2164201.1 hypothetical protein M409DRAFT_25544 [Zasmidium cellare ATCC 36951]
MGANEVVFIIGATGFIGSHVVNYTLQAGYKVRLSIRRKEQEQSIRAWLQGRDENVEFVHIPDLAKPGAFQGVLDGIDYIFHLASPLPGKGDDVRKDYVEPAVTGTTAILEQAKRHERIKFVIVVSSILALIPMGGIRKPPVIPKANSGERLKVDITRKFPAGFPGHGMKYGASKILAQQATRDFVAKERPLFKLITFHPTFVLGDSLIQRTFKELDGMNAQLWNSLPSEEPLIPSAFVHVRDVAQAHVAALRNRDSLNTGTEYILSTQPFGWDRVADVVKAEFPQIDVRLRKGPFSQDDWHVDTTLADRDLQIKWRSGEDMVRNVLNQQLALKQKASL